MNSVVFLGIDGLDADYIDEHLDELPTLRRLREDGMLIALPSIFPPDSIPAWITIFTGEAPDTHGVVESIDYLAKNPAKATERAPSFLRGRTFWDAASERGCRVCVINPFMAYPSWPVNGSMISGPVFVESGVPSLSPADAALGHELPQLGGIVDFPTDRTMGTFLERALEVTREQAEFGLKLLQQTEPDLFFINILTIDRIQHFLWRFCDPGDPTYPGANALDRGVFRAYRAIDDVIDRYLHAAGEGVVLVASDHGHGRRPPLMLYVDELLRRDGLFRTGGTLQTLQTFILERAKRLALTAAFRLGREHEAYALARRVPGRKALKTSSYARGNDCLASASRSFGRNSAGGIEIDATVSGPNRRDLIDRTCALLLSVIDPSGQPVCEWACARDEVMGGVEADRFPDVLFQLREDVGVDFGVFGPLFGPDAMHRRVSGGHRRNGIFASSSASLPFVPGGLAELHDLVLEVTVGARA